MTQIYAIISTLARTAEVARTGRDPGTAVPVDLSTSAEAERAELAAALRSIDSCDRTYRDLVPHGALVLYVPDAADTTAAALLAAVRADAALAATRLAALAAEEAASAERRAAEAVADSTAVRALLPEIEARVAAAEASGVAEAIRIGPVTVRVGERVTAPVDGELWDALTALAGRLGAVRDAAEARQEAAKEARQEAVRAAQATARDGWLRDHASDEQRARAEAHLLPAAEVLAGLEALVWAPFAAQPLYERLDRDDIEHADECGGEVTFRSEPATEASATEFARLQAIRALAPDGAVVTLREHVASCDGEECDVRYRRGIRVEITTGGTLFRREFTA